MPSAPTLNFRSTRNQRGNCTPILATVRLYCILQLPVFLFCPFTHTLIHSVDGGIQDTVPSTLTLVCRSTRNQHGNYTPCIATVRFYCIIQLVVFVFCPFSRSSSHLVDTGIQERIPSMPALYWLSTWNQCGNCIPILAKVRYCIHQFGVVIFCPSTRTLFARLTFGSKPSYHLRLHCLLYIIFIFICTIT
jgi:hypothetical protein